MSDQQTTAHTAASLPAAPTTERPTKRPRRWPWIVGALLLLAGLAAVLFHRVQPHTQSARGKAGIGTPPLMVSTTTAHRGDIGVYVPGLGVVTPVNTVAIKSRVDGQLVAVNYSEGQSVHKGDALVEIDPRPFLAAVTQAEGQLARDTALLENARLDLNRYQEAFAKNAVPKQQLDTQVATVHQYEGAVKLDQGQIENARVQLAYCHITAPLTGRVGLRLVDAGNIVHASDPTPLLIITQLEPITVVFSVAEDVLPQIQQQLRQGKRLTVDALDRAQQKKIASGDLETLDNQIDTTTGTIKLKAFFANADNALFPNQFVNARLLVDTHHDVTLITNTVIQHNAQGPFVYLLEPNQTVTVHAITVGPTDGIVSEVEGLEPGAVIVADNFNRLSDGAKVTVRPPEGHGRGERGGGGFQRPSRTNDATRKINEQ